MHLFIAVGEGRAHEWGGGEGRGGEGVSKWVGEGRAYKRQFRIVEVYLTS